MQDTSCHPTSIPQEIWLSPYFHASILGNWLSPYFQGPGCHPTSVGLFLFSPLVCANKGLSRNDVTLGLLNKADTPPPPDHFSSLFG